MKKKICPVCERELTAAGYCRLCRRLVFKPVVRDVDYYLNETSPEDRTLLNQKRIDETNRLEQEGETDLREKMAQVYQNVRRQAKSLSKREAFPFSGPEKRTGKGKKEAGTGKTGNAGSGAIRRKPDTGRAVRTSGEEFLRWTGRAGRPEKNSGGGWNGRAKGFAGGSDQEEKRKKTFLLVAAVMFCIFLINLLVLLAPAFQQAGARKETAEYPAIEEDGGFRMRSDFGGEDSVREERQSLNRR